MLKGHVHSIESFGTVDGPGIRMVVFLKGCPMRCLYCHNPDTWEMAGGTDMSVEEILRQYEASRHFYTNGGITVTGGEPLMQIDFVTELFQTASHRGIHTCLDTSGITFNPDSPASMEKMDKLMTVTDLVMLDIKHIDEEQHKILTGCTNKNILAMARKLSDMGVSMWIRHVLVPERNDRDDYLHRLADFIATLKTVERVEVLPYHTLGTFKWENLHIDYPLKGINPPTKERIENAEKILGAGTQ